MSETSQEPLPLPETEQQAKARRKEQMTARKRGIISSPAVSAPRPGSDLLCDTWQLNNSQRLLTGFLGLAFLVPYLSLSLTYPEWTGHIGRRLSVALFSFLGQAALLTPFLVAYVVLSCAGFRALRQTRYAFAFPLALTLVMLVERAAQTGGWLGRLLDGALLMAVGPGGAWLVTLSALVLLSLSFFPRAGEELGHGLVLLSETLHERILAWRDRLARTTVATAASADVANLASGTTTQETLPSDPHQRAHPSSAGPATQPLLPRDLETNPIHGAAPSATIPAFTRQLPPHPAAAGLLTSAEWASEEAPSLAMESSEEEDAAPLWASEELCPPPSAELSPLPTFDPPEATSVVAAPPSESNPPVRSPQPSPETTTWELTDDPKGVIPRAKPFELPPLVLLDDVPPSVRRPRTEDKSQALLDALDAFGVKAKLLQIVRGPTVTRYELLPARGVKVSKFTSLTNDIALALASTAVRIEAPIPGKSAIGIEIPNEVTDLVVIKDILRDTTFTESKGLTVALGKDLSGRPVVTDLQKMPHLLVAGTTGSGKSVCVNGLILSLLYRFTPDQLQLMMVDPKQVELSVYEDIPHLVGFSEGGKGEIIVDPKKAAQALYQVVELMEQRYTLFAECRVRNLAEYNAKADVPLPWFVVIIDELADLMMVASKSVETSICRIAQKARAAGIHLVLATQRPSADVITGLIKVNIPSRVAFAVSSQVDSRVILDSGGAEHLLGKGDMLFLPVDASDPRRLQGAYVNNEEISRVVEFWKGQHLPDNRIEFELKEDPIALDDDDGEEDADDALLEEALRAVLQRDQASASMLQTDLKVGYARARRLLMAMEKKGWVSPAEGSKPRKILYLGAASDGPPSDP